MRIAALLLCSTCAFAQQWPPRPADTELTTQWLRSDFERSMGWAGPPYHQVAKDRWGNYFSLSTEYAWQAWHRSYCGYVLKLDDPAACRDALTDKPPPPPPVLNIIPADPAQIQR
jgi:hypothetical protein